MERLDSLSTKKPQLKFKPKIVARKSPQDRTQTIKTPSEAKYKRSLDQRKPRQKNQNQNQNQNNSSSSDVIVSVGPLAQGAISLGNNQQSSSAYRGVGTAMSIKREPGLEFINNNNDNDDDQNNGLIDINNPLINDDLFPQKPPRDKTLILPEEEIIDEISQLNDDYKTIKNLLLLSSSSSSSSPYNNNNIKSLKTDNEGDVKMEDINDTNVNDTPLSFLQLPKLPIDQQESSQGLIGKINIHQSGKISLQIGEIQFDLSIGGELNSNESLWILNKDENFCFNMGDIKNRIIGTPSF